MHGGSARTSPPHQSVSPTPCSLGVALLACLASVLARSRLFAAEHQNEAVTGQPNHLIHRLSADKSKAEPF